MRAGPVAGRRFIPSICFHPAWETRQGKVSCFDVYAWQLVSFEAKTPRVAAGGVSRVWAPAMPPIMEEGGMEVRFPWRAFSVLPPAMSCHRGRKTVGDEGVWDPLA